MKILFVCMGNICRSPMAEYLAKDYIAKHNLNFEADSCGTSSHTKGSHMHNGTEKILSKYGIKVPRHYAKPINEKLFNESNYVVVMDNENYHDVTRKFGNHQKIIKMTNYCDLNYDEVPDPWYTGDFEETYKILTNSIKNFLENISKK